MEQVGVSILINKWFLLCFTSSQSTKDILRRRLLEKTCGNVRLFFTEETVFLKHGLFPSNSTKHFITSVDDNLLGTLYVCASYSLINYIVELRRPAMLLGMGVTGREAVQWALCCCCCCRCCSSRGPAVDVGVVHVPCGCAGAEHDVMFLSFCSL